MNERRGEEGTGSAQRCLPPAERCLSPASRRPLPAARSGPRRIALSVREPARAECRPGQRARACASAAI
jgi:hypothetical protein